MIEAGAAWSAALAKAARDNGVAALKRWQANGGAVVTLSPAVRAQWAEAFPADYIAERAKKVDAMGLPATQVIAAYMKRLIAAGYQPPRKWELGPN
jgi:hypothetical protein